MKTIRFGTADDHGSLARLAERGVPRTSPSRHPSGSTPEVGASIARIRAMLKRIDELTADMKGQLTVRLPAP